MDSRLRGNEYATGGAFVAISYVLYQFVLIPLTPMDSRLRGNDDVGMPTCYVAAFKGFSLTKHSGFRPYDDVGYANRGCICSNAGQL